LYHKIIPKYTRFVNSFGIKKGVYLVLLMEFVDKIR